MQFREIYIDNTFLKVYYNALKTKNFVILAGLSGTGKTKLAELFTFNIYPCELRSKAGAILLNNCGKVYKILESLKQIIKKGLIYFDSYFDYPRVNSKVIGVRGIPCLELERDIKIPISFLCESLLVLNYEKFRKLTSSLGKNSEEYKFFKNKIHEFSKKLKDMRTKQHKNYKYHLLKTFPKVKGRQPIKKPFKFLYCPKILLKSFGISEFTLCKARKAEDTRGKLFVKEALNKLVEDNLLFFPIRPDFRDSKSLLGYYNPLTEKYHSTPLLEFILKAAENYLRKGKEADPFFVLLDEMNLARVEYYFADFLSILEAKKFTSKEEALQNPNFREFLESLNFPQEELNEENFRFSSHGIKLHSEENLKNIPKELFLPPNISFIGTINVDETTHAIAPKVLDRAFTLEFEVDDFEKYLKFLEKSNGADEIIEPSEELKKDFTRGGKFAIIEKETVKEYCNKNPDVVQLLNEINKTLKKNGLHFGYRVFDEIVMFLSNSENSLLELDKDTALDFAIKTKVLPKFGGVRQRLEKPILEILKLFEKRKELEFLNKKKETVKTQTSEEKL